MKVKDLIEKLQLMPQDANVFHLWDGCARTEIQLVWQSKGGQVVTSDYEMVCYHDADRPLDATIATIDPFWSTRNSPMKDCFDNFTHEDAMLGIEQAIDRLKKLILERKAAETPMRNIGINDEEIYLTDDEAMALRELQNCLAGDAK